LVQLMMFDARNLFRRVLLPMLAIASAVYPSLAMARCAGPGQVKNCCQHSPGDGSASFPGKSDHSSRVPAQQCPGTSVCCQMPLLVCPPPLISADDKLCVVAFRPRDLLVGRIAIDSIFHPPRMA
jgi:hypothetical protein